MHYVHWWIQRLSLLHATMYASNYIFTAYYVPPYILTQLTQTHAAYIADECPEVTGASSNALPCSEGHQKHAVQQCMQVQSAFDECTFLPCMYHHTELYSLSIIILQFIIW